MATARATLLMPTPRRALLAAMGLACPGLARASEPILIGGTGTATGLVRHLADAHAALTGQAFRLLPSLGSSGGLRALAAGRIHIALTIHDPGTEGGGLRRQVLGRTPIILATHAAAAPVMLGAAQAARLLTGEERAWPNGAPARLVVRPPNEREWLVLRDGPPELTRAAQGPPRGAGAVIATTAQDNASAICRIEGSLGLISLGQVFTEGLDLRVVGLDGVVPSLASLRDRLWPYAVTLHAAAAVAAPPEVDAFLAFIATPGAAALCLGLGYATGAAAA